MLLSSPDLGVRSHRPNGATPESLTLFGAPCNVDPPFSSNELKLWYRGCQNVPMEVWIRTFFSPSSSPSLTSSARDTVETEPEIEEDNSHSNRATSNRSGNQDNSQQRNTDSNSEAVSNTIISNSISSNINSDRTVENGSGESEDSQLHTNSIPTT